MSLPHCVCFTYNVIDIDMIGEGKEQKSPSPIHSDCFFLLLLLFELQVQQKRLALFSAPAVRRSERLSCEINVKQRIVKVFIAELLSTRELFITRTQRKAVAQNKCFEIGKCSALPCHLMDAVKAVLCLTLQTIQGVPLNFIVLSHLHCR